MGPVRVAGATQRLLMVRVRVCDSIEARQKRQQKLEGRVDVLMSNWQA